MVNPRGLESDSLINLLLILKSYKRSVVPMEKPLGKIEIEAMIQAAVEQTNTEVHNYSRIFADIQM